MLIKYGRHANIALKVNTNQIRQITWQDLSFVSLDIKMFFINYAEAGKTIGKYSNYPLLLTLQTYDVIAVSLMKHFYITTLRWWKKICIVKRGITVYLISIKIDLDSFLQTLQAQVSSVWIVLWKGSDFFSNILQNTWNN